MEWYLYALCAAKAGAMDEARPANDKALRLAPDLPEAHYLAGLFEWRDGHRGAAQAEFLAAMVLDSSYLEPAMARVRSRLPVAPDSLPGRLLTGIRAAELVTSAERPKYDEFIQMEQPAVVTERSDATIPDSLAGRVRPLTYHPIVLFDEHGRPVYHEDPWAAATSAPEAMLGLIAQTISTWRVSPAIRLGHPQALWMQLDLKLVAAKP